MGPELGVWRCAWGDREDGSYVPTGAFYYIQLFMRAQVPSCSCADIFKATHHLHSPVLRIRPPHQQLSRFCQRSEKVQPL